LVHVCCEGAIVAKRILAKDAMFRIEVEQKKYDKWEKRFWKTQKDYTGQGLRKRGFDLMGDVQENTPVRFGYARMGWSGLHKKHGKRPIPKGTDPARQELGYQISQAEDKSEPRYREDPYITITNPIPYILPLEAGHSPKSAPGQMVANNLKRHKRQLMNTLIQSISEAGDHSQRDIRKRLRF
jgi:hypothetical protein